MEILDLSIPVNEDTVIPSMDTGISDPPVRFEPWVEMAHKGYRITKIEMGIHSGTHCDVPSHFVEDGKTVTDYPAEYWVGWAVVMDFRGTGPITIDKILPYKGRIANRLNTIPVLLNTHSDVFTEAALKEFLSWNLHAVLLCEGINLDENMIESSEFLKAGIGMIMNPDYEMVAKVKDGDLIVAVPIKFTGLEAAPMRLIAIRGLISE